MLEHLYVFLAGLDVAEMIPKLEAIQICKNLFSQKNMVVITETKQTGFSGLHNLLISSEPSSTM